LSLLWPGEIEARASELVTTCRWCGTSCQASATADVMCLDVAPPAGQVCVAENGVCVIKDGEGLVIEPTPESWVRPSRTVGTPGVLACKLCNGKYAFKLGNADCDDEIGMLDFEVWKSEFLSKVGKESDFDCDGEIGMLDFEIWKTSFLNRANLPTQVPTAVPTMAPTVQPIGTAVPIATPSPSDSTSNLTCKWCDNGCGSYPDSKVCLTVEPPEGKKCSVVDGVCKVVDEKENVTPTIPKVLPTFSREPPPVDPVM